MPRKKAEKIIYTIGHSTHQLSEFLEILKTYGIQKVVDVRTIPRSRHNPQFNEEPFKNFLKKHRIGYIHLKALGGLRHTTTTSVNTGWYNLSFRGYADYMQTEDFLKGLEKLMKLAEKKQIVIMCAEAVPWRCHRSLIGDALVIRHYDVEDIFSVTSVKPHILTSFAHVWGKKITYLKKGNS